MKRIVFILSIALAGCKYEHEQVSPIFPQPDFPVLVNKIDSISYFAKDKVYSTGKTIVEFNGTFVAKEDCKANVKCHLYLSNSSYGFQYFLRTSSGKLIGKNDVFNNKNFNDSRDIVGVNVSLKKGESIEAYIGYSSAETKVYYNGAHLGRSDDLSYLIVETF